MTAGVIDALTYARTDTGRAREHNEDTFLVADLSEARAVVHSERRSLALGDRGLLFLVADGMGGAAAGELASAMAADLIHGHLMGTWAREAEPPSPERFVRCLREAVELANLQIHGYTRTHPEVRGMGTTATVAGVLGQTLYLAQIGDSRAYLVREGAAVQLTKDQSLTQRLVDAGELTEAEAAASSRKNIILQALGPDPQVKVDLTLQDLAAGDLLVLCSDGLSNLVPRDEIAALAQAHDTLEALADALVDLANARGGPDNITVVLVRFEGPALPSAVAAGRPAYTVLADPEPVSPTRLPVPATPSTRTGAPIGMAILIAGVLLTLLALFLALA